MEIGNLCWMAKNLNIGKMIYTYDNQSNNSTIEKYCYENDGFNCFAFGGLYQWYEAMQYVTTKRAKGICPIGWHIPSDHEWKTITSEDFKTGGSTLEL